MRPPARKASMFHQPFDYILGTQASIRLLRELALHGGELPLSHLVKQTGLSYPGVHEAMSRLLLTGIVEMLGSGRSVLYRLNKGNILSEEVQNLFLRERERVDITLARVREYAEQSEPRPRAIWIYGSTARQEDSPGSDIDFMVVVEDGVPVQEVCDSFQEAMSFTSEWSLYPSVVVLTRHDIRDLIAREPARWHDLREDVIAVSGCIPDELSHG
jgi:predicted nucleotidyltransferase